VVKAKYGEEGVVKAGWETSFFVVEDDVSHPWRYCYGCGELL